MPIELIQHAPLIAFALSAIYLLFKIPCHLFRLLRAIYYGVPISPTWTIALHAGVKFLLVFATIFTILIIWSVISYLLHKRRPKLP